MCSQRAAVVSAPAADDFEALGLTPVEVMDARELDAKLGRLGAGRNEIDLFHLVGREAFDNQIGQLERRLV